MTREEFVTRRRTRQSEWACIGALVDGARLCEDVLQDFEAVTRAEDDAELSLFEAAAESAYSRDHLRPLHRSGSLPGAEAFTVRSCRGCSAGLQSAPRRGTTEDGLRAISTCRTRHRATSDRRRLAAARSADGSGRLVIRCAALSGSTRRD